MDLVGYTNRLNVTPGATLDFMVSSRVGAYDVDIVRLIHGDNSPSGPGFKSTGICRLAEGVAGREYSLPRGSYVVTSQGLTVDLSQGLTVSLWLFPTSLGPGREAVISLGGDTGFAIGLDADGCLGFALAGNLTTLAQPVAVSEWSFVCATYAPDGRVEMWHRTRAPHPLVEPAHISEVLANADAEVHGSYFLIGAQSRDTVVQPESAECHFNGKIATPRVYAASVEAADLPVLLRTIRRADWLIGRRVLELQSTTRRYADRGHVSVGAACDGRQLSDASGYELELPGGRSELCRFPGGV